VQYTRLFTQRFMGNAAVRLTRSTDVGDVALDDSGNRDRANVQLALSYLFTQEWTLSGGYRFAYQALPSYDITGINLGQVNAHSNGVFITVAYHGREPPR
jgi:long-subunit fatty acid transport protein